MYCTIEVYPLHYKALIGLFINKYKLKIYITKKEEDSLKLNILINKPKLYSSQRFSNALNLASNLLEYASSL